MATVSITPKRFRNEKLRTHHFRPSHLAGRCWQILHPIWIDLFKIRSILAAKEDEVLVGKCLVICPRPPAAPRMTVILQEQKEQSTLKFEIYPVRSLSVRNSVKPTIEGMFVYEIPVCSFTGS